MCFNANDSPVKVIAVEKSGKYLEMARRYWTEAGVIQKMDVRLGDANVTLDKMLEEGLANTVDFIYIDADKASYRWKQIIESQISISI